MSKVSQELKVLLYLNQRYSRTNWVTIREIAEYLEISERQARRYLEDLDNIQDITVKTKLGRNGGYKLEKPLDKGFAMPENIVLAMSIAMKRNERIEKVLSALPNYVITDVIEGDNQIDNKTLDNLETIIKAIQDQKEIIFDYKKHKKQYYVQPYSIVLTNHTYYLYLVHEDVIKTFSIGYMENIKILGSFKPDKHIVESIKVKIANYGIKDGIETTLRVKCIDEETLLAFDRYYEGKGKKDIKELTYVVTSNSKNELYYPLFRVSTKKYKFLDEDIKVNYLRYLERVIRSIESEN